MIKNFSNLKPPNLLCRYLQFFKFQHHFLPVYKIITPKFPFISVIQLHRNFQPSIWSRGRDYLLLIFSLQILYRPILRIFKLLDPTIPTVFTRLKNIRRACLCA